MLASMSAAKKKTKKERLLAGLSPAERERVLNAILDLESLAQGRRRRRTRQV
jgi:hypothetical protein